MSSIKYFKPFELDCSVVKGHSRKLVFTTMLSINRITNCFFPIEMVEFIFGFVNLKDIFYPQINLMEAKLCNTDLSFINLSGSNLKWTELYGANLSYADLSQSNLERADLEGVNLRGADLSYADLSRSNLIDANLIDAKLRGANLRGADLVDSNFMTFCCGRDQEDCEGQCEGPETVRQFSWHCRPRPKYNISSYYTTIDICFCNYHYNKIVEKNQGQKPTAIGHDAWDALDGLVYNFIK